MNINSRTKHRILLILITLFFAALLWAAVSGVFYTAEAAEVGKLYVRITADGREYVYKSPDIEYVGGIDKALQEGFERDFRGRLTKQIKPLQCSYRLRGAADKLSAIAKDFYKEPQDARIIFSPDSRVMFDITPDIKGRELDIAVMLKAIDRALSAGHSFDAEAQAKSISARHTYASLKRSTGQRQEFYTSFPASTPERKHNIALSLSKINGTVLAPGEEFSFNRTVGQRTEARGFKEAKIILGGEFVEGTGGGVCQASTTLYNAALLAGLKISEQHRHSLSVSYIKPSFDAMVNSGTADLKFVNDSGNFVFIKAFTKGDTAVVRIYGEKNPYKIVRKSLITKTHIPPRERVITDTEGKYPNIYQGMRKIVQYSKPKLESVGMLQYYRLDGSLAFEKTIRKDVYGELAGLEVIGTAPPPHTPPE